MRKFSLFCWKSSASHWWVCYSGIPLMWSLMGKRKIGVAAGFAPCRVHPTSTQLLIKCLKIILLLLTKKKTTLCARWSKTAENMLISHSLIHRRWLIIFPHCAMGRIRPKVTGELEVQSSERTRWGQTRHGAKLVSFKLGYINGVAA